MYRSLRIALSAVLAVGFIATLTSTPARAENTLKKMGNAIQYPVRKAGENASIDTHRAMGRKSIEKSNRTGRKIIITSGGHKKLLHPYHVRHHRYRRHHPVH